MPITRRGILYGSLGAAAAGLTTRRVAAAPEPIRFGWLTALTGANSAPGVGFNRGIVYAANKINAAGGVNGRMIDVITRDSSGDPAKAVNAATDLASNQKVHAVFGPVNSGESLATTPIFTRFKVPSLGICVVDSLIDPEKFPNAFRLSPDSSQWDDAVRHYVLDILKLKKVAVLGDNTGYGTTATAGSVANFRKDGAEVVYSEVIDANAQDVSPNLLHARDAGAQAIACWSDSTGLDARIMNARGRIGWDVVMAGHPALGSGDVAHLLEKPEYWDKVFTVGYRSCSYNADGMLPPRMAAFVDEVKGKVELQDTLLWWVTAGVDAVTLVVEAVSKTGSSDSDKIIAYWNGLSTWPGLFGDYAFSPKEHNGYPTSEIVMSAANSSRNGAMTLAPGA
ncbi:MAG: ABC transporter substrate-binding protein [Acetobacteraceae bacterium]|jgi:branched-chain amino acid transport system substrate-binding protein